MVTCTDLVDKFKMDKKAVFYNCLAWVKFQPQNLAFEPNCLKQKFGNFFNTIHLRNIKACRKNGFSQNGPNKRYQFFHCLLPIVAGDIGPLAAFPEHSV